MSRLRAEPPVVATPWYAVGIVWLVIAVPAAAVIVGFTMLGLAISSNDGLVVDDYYKRGRAINRVLDRDLFAARHGLAAALKFEGDGLSVSLTSQAPVSLPATIRVQILHPTRGGFDQVLDATKVREGLYRAALTPVHSSRWLLQIETEQWRLSGTAWLPSQTSVALAAE